MNFNSSSPGMGWEGQAEDAIPEEDPGRMWQMRKGNSWIPDCPQHWQEPQTQQWWKNSAVFGSKPLLWWANFILQVKGRVSWGLIIKNYKFHCKTGSCSLLTFNLNLFDLLHTQVSNLLHVPNVTINRPAKNGSFRFNKSLKNLGAIPKS